MLLIISTLKRRLNKLKEKVSFFKKLSGYLVGGVVFLFPIILLGIILLWLGGHLESIGRGFLEIFIADRYIFFGFGLILALLFILSIGVAIEKFKIFQKILGKVPGIGPLFISQKMGSKLTLNELLSLTPCLFLFSPTCPSYGWVMKEQKTTLFLERGRIIKNPWIYVYYPNVPSMITGQIFLVPEKHIIKLGNPSALILKALLYNLETPEELLLLPWDEETDEEFEKRVKIFEGLN